MLKRCIFTVSFMIMAISLFAEVSSSTTNIIIQKQMFLQDLIYPYNVDGARMLVNDIQVTNVDLYNRLNPLVNPN